MSRTGPSNAGEPAAEIAAFLATLPGPMGQALQRLREMIARAAPDSVEAISYGAPAFRYRGRPLVSYGAAKEHVSLYVTSPAVVDAFRDELSGYDLSKGTVRFTPGSPLSETLVARIVRARMAETDAAAVRKG